MVAVEALGRVLLTLAESWMLELWIICAEVCAEVLGTQDFFYINHTKSSVFMFCLLTVSLLLLSLAASLIRGNRANCALFCDNLDWLVSQLDRLEASSGT